MFARFRQRRDLLLVSLVEAHRAGGKVRQGHIAYLGSIALPLTVEARIAFWQHLHDRLAKLSNRVDAETQAKVLAAIHVRIPMVTVDEQQALKIENAMSEEQFWSGLHDIQASAIEDQKGLAETVEYAIASQQADMTEAASKRDAAMDRRERLQRGEDVPGGLGRAFTREDLIKAGFTEDDLRHFELMASIHEGEAWEQFKQEFHRRHDKAFRRNARAAAHKILRQQRADAADGD
jgi:hypothetical protein